MSYIDSGSLDSINLPPGFKINIFADELGGSSVFNKSHGLGCYDLLYFDLGTGGNCERDLRILLVMAIIFFGVAISRFRFEQAEDLEYPAGYLVFITFLQTSPGQPAVQESIAQIYYNFCQVFELI